MDILHALLWKQFCPGTTGRREDLLAAGPNVWFRPLLAVMLIAILVGFVDLAARGDGADIATISDHFVGKEN